MGAKKMFSKTRVQTLVYLDPDKKEFAAKARSMSTYINHLIAEDIRRFVLVPEDHESRQGAHSQDK